MGQKTKQVALDIQALGFFFSLGNRKLICFSEVRNMIRCICLKRNIIDIIYISVIHYISHSIYDKLRLHIKKQRHDLPTQVHIVKAMVFPVVMYGYESWTIKKAECQRIDAFELWCWRRLLRVPWTERRSKLSGLMLKLKLQYFGHLMQRADSLENMLMLGKIEGRRRRGR